MLTTIRNWSEAWSLLIPLLVIVFQKRVRAEMYPLFIYVLIAFVLNLTATTIFAMNKSMPAFLKNNNVFYNLHSITRVLFLGTYFFGLQILRFTLFYKILLVGYIGFILLDFLFFESLFRFSNVLFTVESILLLIVCLTFLFQAMRDESQVDWIKHPAFLVFTGVGLYEAVNFFIFLAFYDLVEKDRQFGKLTMTIHNMTFVVFCILLALAFYKYEKRSPVYRRPSADTAL